MNGYLAFAEAAAHETGADQSLVLEQHQIFEYRPPRDLSVELAAELVEKAAGRITYMGQQFLCRRAHCSLCDVPPHADPLKIPLLPRVKPLIRYGGSSSHTPSTIKSGKTGLLGPRW